MFFLLTLCIATKTKSQNRNFLVSISLGIGNSRFNIENQSEEEIRRLFYPTGGLQIQKRINSKWAINFYPNVGMSGKRIILSKPVENITEIKSTSAFMNFSLCPKYYLKESIYLSLGPELSYLLWNYGSKYRGDKRISNIEETEFFNRINLLVSSSIGFSKKVTESRHNAPIQIDFLWFLELRAKKGITNILNKKKFGESVSSTVLAFEIVTGFSFASKE